jgi:formate dehydrogenase alpha subunit
MSDDISLIVDGNQVSAPAGASVLDACHKAGASVPTLCHRADTAAGQGGGHCRMCLVEVDGRAVASCVTPARAHTTVATTSKRLVAYRKDLAALSCAEAAPAGVSARLLEETGADPGRYASTARDPRQDSSHPYLRLELSRCIRCRLCEQACGAIQGRFVLGFSGRGAQTRLAWDGPGEFAASSCVACGACVAACPTGAISDVDRRSAPAQTQVVRTTCSYCGVGCSLDVHVASDEVVRIDGGDGPANRGHLCVKGRYAHRFVHHPDRLRQPLLRKHGQLVPVSWDEAISHVATTLLEVRARHGADAIAGLSSSRCTNEENYLLQKWMRAGLGTNNVDCCARVCHGPSARGLRHSFGTGAATNSFADLDVADVLLAAGTNATEAHPVVGARIVQAVLGGAKLIVIDPRRTDLAAVATIHLQLRPGKNVLVLNALARAILDDKLEDHRFIDERTEGYAELRAHLQAYAPEAIADEAGVRAEDLRAAARLYASARAPMQVHGLGMTEHYQGAESVMLLANLAMLVGAIGRPGVGVNPLRGQNNVQGAADMGCQPDAWTGYADPTDPAVQARFAQVWGRPGPTQPGLTIPGMYAAARRKDVRAMFILGEDVVQTDPACHVDEALAALDFLVVQEIFLSETARLAHVVLPGTSFLEKDGTFTNGERRIQRVRQVVQPVGDARPDWQILCGLASATGMAQNFTHPEQIMAEVSRVAPAFTGVRYNRLGHDGLQWPVPAADHPGTAILHAQSFPRGRGRFACVDFVASPALAGCDRQQYPLLLTTGRVLEHYNTGSMTRRGDNLALHAHDFLELSASDAASLAITDGAAVVVESPWGQAHAIARVTSRVAEGTAFLSFHFPETGTNRLISPVVDRLADCPEYKVTPVTVRPAPLQP